ncbi:sensor histidine kinase [Nocardioides zeicaulis]|uniref:histidine kinase n=1 Tax=Nocardioides zeicaulis TaxID=1776857 RepID=A0ABV6E013_9ACTN
MPDQPIAGSRYSWSDPASRETLQLIAEGIARLSGFAVVTIGLVRSDDSLQVVAIAGSEEARRDLEDVLIPMADLRAELAEADDWGRLRFVPAERVAATRGAWGWVPELDRLDVEDAWDPHDYLAAPLHDAEGSLVGILSVDVPTDGRRPGEAQREVLNVHAEQAERAVVLALERERLAEQVRVSDAARRIVREASAQLSIERILQDSTAALVEGFRAAGMWLQTTGTPGEVASHVHTSSGEEVSVDPALAALVEQVAQDAWRRQDAVVVAPGHDLPVTPEQREMILDLLRDLDVGSVLFVPLGAGPECVGHLALTRLPGAPVWTAEEAAAALDIGHDLGRAILNARTFEREHHLVRELRALDDYKGRMISTVAHELKNPLASVRGHLDLLELADELSEESRGWLAALDRGAQRMGRVIDDLLLLARVGEAGHPLVARPVDLRQVVADAVDVVALTASRKGVLLHVDLPAHPVTALGDADEIDRVCVNLLSNAVKYTREGGSVTVDLALAGDQAVLTCSDQGIGISAGDQERIGTEFFRSTNPEAVAESGTGLGLAIVRRVIDRHHGHLEIESELGRGSTFRVRLPAA